MARATNFVGRAWAAAFLAAALLAGAVAAMRTTPFSNENPWTPPTGPAADYGGEGKTMYERRLVGYKASVLHFREDPWRLSREGKCPQDFAHQEECDHQAAEYFEEVIR